MLNDLPKELDDVQIIYAGSRRVLEHVEEHTLEFSWKEKRGVAKLHLPRPRKDGYFFWKDQYYYPIPCFAKPLTLVDLEGQSISLKNILSDFMSGYNFDWQFRMGKRGPFMAFLGRRIFDTPSPYTLKRFVLRKSDRQALNSFTGLSVEENILTMDDINFIVGKMENNFAGLATTDWKDLGKMRICTLEEMLTMIVAMNIPKTLRNFKTRGEVYEHILNKSISAYILEGSQCQLDTADTVVAKQDMAYKIALPIGQFDGVYAAEPHPTWVGFIDSLNTPQTEKCGAVVHRCDGVEIVDGQLQKTGDHVHSPLMRQAVVFPQLLKAHRQVMCSAISKQCCPLGPEGKHDQPRWVLPHEHEKLPPLHGRNVLLALMDWHLFTHEDACVISQSLASKLTTSRTVTTTYFDVDGDPHLAVKEGDSVYGNSVIGLFSDMTTTMVVQNKVPGIITHIEQFDHEIEGKKVKCVRVAVRCDFVCMIGSKLSNLHSCKSIVSKILPDILMPTMSDGTPVEMIISPMSVGNRVNPSLLLEGMLGMQSRETGTVWEFDPFINKLDGKPLFDWAADRLREAKLPDDSMFQLTDGRGGKKFQHKTFVGYVYLMRLHHHADEKIMFQSKVIADHTGMAVLGRGNTRYGREELEILYQHQAKGVIKEMMENNEKTAVGKLIPGLARALGYEYVA